MIYDDPVGPYEHHSNILPWRESRADVVYIKEDAEGMLDLQHLNSVHIFLHFFFVST